MENRSNKTQNIMSNVERKTRGATTVSKPQIAAVAAATTTMVLLALGLFCCASFSFSSVRFFGVSINELCGPKISLYLRSNDIRSDSDNANSTVVGKFEPSDSKTASVEHQTVRNKYRTDRRRLMVEGGSTNQEDFVEWSRKNHFPLFEASDTYNVIGPTVFPKPTYKYEAEADGKKIDGEIATYLQPTSGKHRPNQDSVFVFAAEYTFDTYMLFFMTLYETGYKGDVVVGVSKMDWEKKEIREFLEYWKNESKGDQMTVVVYVVPYHCYDLEGRVLPSHKGGMRVCQCHNMFGRKNKDTGEITPLLDKRHGRTAQTIRYELYWIWSEYYNPTKWILLIDARDTIFQEKPFERVPRRAATKEATTDKKKKKQRDNDEGGTLIFFGESADATSLGKSKFNRRWLQLAYGDMVANAFRKKPTICSGSTMGEQFAIETYLRAEVSESDESKTVIFGADQGFHNYLYYSNKLRNARAISKILVQDQGLAIVNNMGAFRDMELSTWGNGKMVEKNDTVITIRNWDGTVSPIVHQYDRHTELSRWWHKKRCRDFQNQWKEMKRR